MSFELKKKKNASMGKTNVACYAITTLLMCKLLIFFFILEMIVMAIVLLTGSLLLLVNNYASSPDKALITDTALGVLLLLFAALLAYSGSLCLTLF